MAVVLIFTGTSVCLLSLFADILGFGGQSQAMGWKQWAGVTAGLLASSAGLGLIFSFELARLSRLVEAVRGEQFQWLRERWKAALSVSLLIVVVSAAMLLRVRRIDNALPYPGHVDEQHLSDRAGMILKSGDFNPHWFVYPSFPIYLTAAGLTLGYLNAASRLEVSSTDDIGSLAYPYFSQPSIMRAAKTLFALLSVCAILFMGVVAYRVYDNVFLIVLVPFVMILSSLYMLYSANYLNVNIIGGFAVALSYLYLFKYLDQDTLLHKAVVPGILSGMVVSSKYTLFWIVVPFAIAIVLYSREHRARKLVVLIVLVFLSVLALNPFILVDYDIFLDNIGWIVGEYAAGHGQNPKDPGWPHFASYVEHMVKDWGFGTFILMLVGFVSTFKKNWRHALILSSYPLLLLLYLSTQRVGPVRNIVSVLAFWALYASIGIVVTYELISRVLRRIALFHGSDRLKHLAAATIVLLLIVVVLPVQRPIVWAQQPPDSRTRMSAWIMTNLPTGSVLVVPDELFMDTGSLEEDYRVLQYAFKNLAKEGFYGEIAKLDQPYVLMPAFGYDLRKPAGIELAERLNSFGDDLVFLYSISGNQTIVNSRFSVSSGNPSIKAGTLVLDDDERAKLLSRRVIDLVALEGEMHRSPDGTLRLPWKTKLQSPPMALEPGAYEIKLVTKGTPVEGINVLFRVYLGKDNLLGEFYSQETYEETSLFFEVPESTEASLLVEFANDGAEKDEHGEIVADRTGYIQSITIYRLD